MSMKKFCLRIPVDDYERLDWLADEQGCLDRAELIRRILADAVKDAQAPPFEPVRIVANPEQFARWEQLAAKLGRPIEVIAGDILDRLAAKVEAA
jgi:hypothetical protein